MKVLEFIKNRQKRANLCAAILALAVLAVGIWGFAQSRDTSHTRVDDGIEQIDLDTIYLKNSGTEVNFAQVLLSEQNETRKLIVSTQKATVSTQLTDRLIQQLDFDFLKKTQSVSYTGTGYFVVDLDHFTASNIIQDKSKKTVTIKVGHPYLEAVDIDPGDIIIDEVKEGLLARGDIKLSVNDYNIIEKELRNRLEEEFDTVANGQDADDVALKMVKKIYEPIVKAIDPRYEVIVQFK